MQLIASLAVIATVASTAHALGKAIIYNQCSFPTYVWPTDIDRPTTEPITIPAGGSYSETYNTPASGGVSLKLSKTSECTSGYITQFEYTVQPWDGTNFVWYDGSNVNCDGVNCPFVSEGLFLTTSQGSSCPQRTCSPGEAPCTGFYTLYNDDLNSLSCNDTADTIMYLCATSDSGSTTTPASSSSSASSPTYSATSVASSSSSSVVASVHSSKSSTSTSASTYTTPAPASTKTFVQYNEAVVTTFVTVTQVAKRQPSARAVHDHARRHQH